MDETITAATLTDHQRREARALLDRVEHADGVAAFSEAFVRGLDREENSHFVAIDGGQLTGLAALAPDGSAELAVDPASRGRGIGAALARAVLDANGSAGLWAHGDLPPARALAASLSLESSRELLVMSVTGDALAEIGAAGTTAEALETTPGIEELSYPDAVSRFGKDTVEEAWLKVNNEAFSWHPEQGGWDRARLTDGMSTDWFDPNGVRFLWDGDTLVGFHWTKRHSTTEGEVYVVGLAEAYRGKGLGDPLMRAGVEHLVDGGAQSVILYVEADNVPAVRRYEEMGFEVVERHVVYGQAGNKSD